MLLLLHQTKIKMKNKILLIVTCIILLSLVLTNVSASTNKVWFGRNESNPNQMIPILLTKNGTLKVDLNLSTTDKWNTNLGLFTDVNSTQHENNAETLTIKESWISSLGNTLWCALTGCEINGDVNVTGNLTVNDTLSAKRINMTSCIINGSDCVSNINATTPLTFEAERTTVVSSQYWAYGNGAQPQGTPVLVNGNLTTFGVACKTVGTTLTMEVHKNGVNVCQVTVGSTANLTFSNLTCNEDFAIGDLLGFFANTETGTYATCTASAIIEKPLGQIAGLKGDTGATGTDGFTPWTNTSAVATLVNDMNAVVTSSFNVSNTYLKSAEIGTTSGIFTVTAGKGVVIGGSEPTTITTSTTGDGFVLSSGSVFSSGVSKTNDWQLNNTGLRGTSESFEFEMTGTGAAGIGWHMSLGKNAGTSSQRFDGVSALGVQGMPSLVGSLNVTTLFYDTLTANSPHFFNYDDEVNYTRFCMMDSLGFWDMSYLVNGSWITEINSRRCIEKSIKNKCKENSTTYWDGEECKVNLYYACKETWDSEWNFETNKCEYNSVRESYNDCIYNQVDMNWNYTTSSCYFDYAKQINRLKDKCSNDRSKFWNGRTGTCISASSLSAEL